MRHAKQHDSLCQTKSHHLFHLAKRFGLPPWYKALHWSESKLFHESLVPVSVLVSYFSEYLWDWLNYVFWWCFGFFVVKSCFSLFLMQQQDIQRIWINGININSQSVFNQNYHAVAFSLIDYVFAWHLNAFTVCSSWIQLSI